MLMWSNYIIKSREDVGAWQRNDYSIKLPCVWYDSAVGNIANSSHKGLCFDRYFNSIDLHLKICDQIMLDLQKQTCVNVTQLIHNVHIGIKSIQWAFWAETQEVGAV